MLNHRGVSPASLLFGTSLLLASFAAPGCASSNPPPNADAGGSCAADPFQCPQGQTCWPIGATTLACLASRPSAGVGASCEDSINLATCADGLACISPTLTANGSCRTATPLTLPCRRLVAQGDVGGDAGPVVQLCTGG